MEPSIDLHEGKASGLKRGPEIGANFVAARSNRWAGCGNQVRRPAAELARQRVDSDARDGGRQTSPACVRGSHRAGAAVGHEQRDAVGSLNRETERRVVGEDDIGLGFVRRHSVARSPHHDIRVVHLPDALELLRLDRKRPGHITPDRGLLVDSTGTQRPLARRKEMLRQRFERHAHERRASVGLRPAEAAARLRELRV